MKKAILCIALTAALSTSAFALEVPSETVVQNLNGSQQVIKTYTLPPEGDPQELIEEPFCPGRLSLYLCGYCENRESGG